MPKSNRRARGPEMAPAYDRKRTSPVRITDHERVGIALSQGYEVVKIETIEGSRVGSVTWRTMPQPSTLVGLEAALLPFYDSLSHGV